MRKCVIVRGEQVPAGQSQEVAGEPWRVGVPVERGWLEVNFFSLNFLFCIGVWLINNVVIVSDEQQRDSAVLPKPSLPSKLPHIIKQSSMCNSRSLLVIRFKYSSVDMRRWTF